MKKWLLAASAVVLVIAAMVYSQKKKADERDRVARPIMAALCSHRESILVGIQGDKEVRSYVDACNQSTDHNMISSSHPMDYFEFAYPSQISPGGTLEIRRSNNGATFFSVGRSFTVSLDDIVSPLRWSPDGRFVFYVGKSKTFSRPPLSECLDDSFLIHVIDTADKTDAVVSKVCAGFPYWSLGWLQKPV